MEAFPLAARLAARLRSERTMRELSALGDRQLDDIGLLRCDIRHVAGMPCGLVRGGRRKPEGAGSRT